MNVTRRSLLRGIGTTGLSLSFIGHAGANEDGGAQYIVVADDDAVPRRLEREGFEIRRTLAAGAVLQVVGPAGEQAALADVRGITAVARNAMFGLEGPALEESFDDGNEQPAYWDLQWDKRVTDCAPAHELATGEGARIAILDTGIDPAHPDLATNVNEDLSALFSSGNPINDDPWDHHYHGTHVAGIAAATGDVGVLGTAPAAELVSLRVFWFEDPEGHEDEDEPFLTTTTADILAAIATAADIGADAANMSLGTPPLPPEFNRTGMRVAYERVIQYATRRGTVVVASAGNSGANLQQGGYFTVPNSTAGALSVSATGPNDERVFYSNYGTNEIDVGAPGGGYETLEKTIDPDADVAWPYPTNLVLSALPLAEMDPRVDGPYGYLAGTSMASPQVSGTVALVRDLAPDATAGQVERIIKQGCDGADGQRSADTGAGRLNARSACELADD